MNFYRVLRDNKELGPFSLDEIKKLGLRSSDLIWVDGKSAAWRFADEVPGLLALMENRVNTGEPTPRGQDSFTAKPKKRYRLTADHRMVEITEEEAKSSAVPRIEEQPPAPKDAPRRSPQEDSKEDDVMPFQEIPFGRKRPVEDDSFPLEPELTEKAAGKTVPVESTPFYKKTEPVQDDTTFPLEPELSAQSNISEPFVDVDSDSEIPTNEDSTAPNNSGAFILAGLLFLVAIGFFGYKWYKDQNAPQNGIETAHGVDSLHKSEAELSEDNPNNNGFFNSKSIAMHDDTLGLAQRTAAKRVQDSIKRVEAAKVKLAARERAKADSIRRALESSLTENPVADEPAAAPEKPKTVAAKNDTAKENKVNKIRTTEDIGKYVKVGVVQPKTQTNGVSGVKLVVHNINNRNLAKVHINVMYFDANGNIIKKSSIIAPNITTGNSVTVPIADNNEASYVSYKVTGLSGDHVNLQAK